MFMRRILILGAACALALTLALSSTLGSALAAPNGQPAFGQIPPPRPVPPGVVVHVHSLTYGGGVNTVKEPVRSTRQGVSPNVSTQCTITIFDFVNKPNFGLNSYNECNLATSEMDSTIVGDHCRLWLFGCVTWTPVFFPAQCSQGFGYQQWCPQYNYYVWNVPSGWLVRGRVQACANTYDEGRICSLWTYTNNVQF
jgi:hypothetical protein